MKEARVWFSWPFCCCLAFLPQVPWVCFFSWFPLVFCCLEFLPFDLDCLLLLQFDTPYLIIYFLFNLLLWTYPLFCMYYPYWVCGGTDHVFIPFYLTWSMGIPWIFPYWWSPTIYSSPSVAMFFFHFPLSPTLYPYDQGCTDFHCDGHTPASLSSYLPYASFHIILLYSSIPCIS